MLGRRKEGLSRDSAVKGVAVSLTLTCPQPENGQDSRQVGAHTSWFAQCHLLFIYYYYLLFLLSKAFSFRHCIVTFPLGDLYFQNVLMISSCFVTFSKSWLSARSEAWKRAGHPQPDLLSPAQLAEDTLHLLLPTTS